MTRHEDPQLQRSLDDLNAEGRLVFQATVIDPIGREVVERYCFFADSIEEARPRAWRRAGRYETDVFVKVEQLSH